MDATLATAAGRTTRREVLINGVSTWTARRDRDDIVELCADAGVPSAPVHNESEVLFAEPFATGFWAGEEREHVGYHQYPLMAFTIAGAHIASPGPAPTLGQHNAEVFAGMGLGAAELNALRAEGVVGEVPAG